MKLSEYREIKLNEVDYFFRGIHFENIGKKNAPIIDSMVIEGEFVNLDFINQNKLWRKLIESALIDIKGYRSELEFIYLDNFQSHTATELKKEIDTAVGQFYNKVINRLNELNNTFLKVFYKDKTNKKNGASLLDTSLNFFKINSGNNIYDWGSKETSNRKERNPEVVDDLRLILLYIYTLPKMLKDRDDKLSNLQEEIFNSGLIGQDFMKQFSKAARLTMERDYSVFDEKYNEMKHKSK